jgi:hypothetical protein
VGTRYSVLEVVDPQGKVIRVLDKEKDGKLLAESIPSDRLFEMEYEEKAGFLILKSVEGKTLKGGERA